MPESIITEPQGPTHTRVSDFTTWKDDEGHVIQYPARYEVFQAAGTIGKYDAVALVAPATGTPMTVEELDVSDAFAALMFVGVAQEAVTVGQLVKVCVWGFTLANVDTGDPVFGDVAIKGGADGQLTTAGTAGGTWDGSDVAGTGLAVFLGVEDSSDIAPIFIRGPI